MAAIAILAVLGAAGIASALTGGGPGRRHAPVVAAPSGAPSAAPRTGPPTTPSAAATPAGDAASGWHLAWSAPAAWQYGVAGAATIRDTEHLLVGGSAVRLHLTNLALRPVTLASLTVGLVRAGASLVAGTVRPVTFGGAAQVVLAAGASALSDPVTITVPAGATLAVSMDVPGSDVPVTVHPCCVPGEPSYFTANGAGAHAADVSGAAFSLEDTWSRWLDAIDVYNPALAPTVVAFGDSITEGFHAGGVRWPDVLTGRLGSRVAVVDAGVTANALTAVIPSDAYDGGGPPGVQRFARDVLDQPGVGTVFVLIGTNDLWFGQSAAGLEAGLRGVALRARAHGLRVLAGTLLPRQGSERWTPAMELSRQAVNAWITANAGPGRLFGAVVHFTPFVGDVFGGACDPQRLWPGFDSGDHLHPNAAGERAMATALRWTAAGLEPAPVTSAGPEPRTPGCV